MATFGDGKGSLSGTGAPQDSSTIISNILALGQRVRREDLIARMSKLLGIPQRNEELSPDDRLQGHRFDRLHRIFKLSRSGESTTPQLIIDNLINWKPTPVSGFFFLLICMIGWLSVLNILRQQEKQGGPREMENRQAVSDSQQTLATPASTVGGSWTPDCPFGKPIADGGDYRAGLSASCSDQQNAAFQQNGAQTDGSGVTDQSELMSTSRQPQVYVQPSNASFVLGTPPQAGSTMRQPMRVVVNR